MIKASAGGGGKGMRIAWNDEETKWDVPSVVSYILFYANSSTYWLILKPPAISNRNLLFFDTVYSYFLLAVSISTFLNKFLLNSRDSIK